MLGNHEDCVWTKSDHFAPVLCQDSLCFLVSLVVQKKCPLCQGDCKNAFCQDVLPNDKVAIVCPPHSAPGVELDKYWLLQWTLYGLCCSPCHWYDKINAILRSFGLQPSLEDPCLYSGFIRDPSNPSSIPSTTPLTLGLYINDVVYFSKDPAVKAHFCRLLAERSKVDFMGVVEWFLGIYFLWRITPSSILVHFNQLGFASTVVESFFHESHGPTSTATPYRAGVPIDSIAPSQNNATSPAQIR